MILERLRTYPLEKLGSGEDALDGPFVLPSGAFGMLVSLRGDDGGVMPSPAELYWRRDLPAAAARGALHVFFRRRDGALYLGTARVARRGTLRRDGYKVALELVEPLDIDAWREYVAYASAPLPPPPEEAIASLPIASTTAQRLAAMRTFVDRWWGARPATPSTTPPPLPSFVPEPLRLVYELVAGLPVWKQNRLVESSRLAIEDGRITFYIENQGVFVWACEASGADPVVLVRGSESLDPWRHESPALSSFLLQTLVQEAVFAAPFSASHDSLDAPALKRLLKRVPELPLPPWEASFGLRFLGANGVIGVVIPNGGDVVTVVLGSMDRERFDPLASLLETWPHLGF